MRKKLFLLTILLLSQFVQVNAQGIVVQGKDGSFSIFPSSEVEKIYTISAKNSYIMGNWYLGWWRNGDNEIHYEGDEYISFVGDSLYYWHGTECTPYKVNYYPRMGYFSARGSKDKTKSIKWYVTEQTSERLILREVEDVNSVCRYFYRSPLAASKSMIEKFPTDHKETTNINTLLALRSGKTASTKTPMGKHFENRHVTTDDDRAWLLDPANEPNVQAGLAKWVAKTVKLYPYNDPVPADVNQHSIGDCCALASLASFAYLYPDFIKAILTDNGNKTYTVKMYDPQGLSVDVCVSNKILCDDNSNIGQCTGKNNAVTWATILEKAAMKWQAIYQCNTDIGGIGTEHFIPLFTGDGDTYGYGSNALYTSELKLMVEHSFAEGKFVIGGFNKKGIMCGTLETVTGHAFTFMLSDSDDVLFVMRNPWGNGDHGEDGRLLIPDVRTTVQTIDCRICPPGAAAPYLRKDLLPYTPPKYVRKAGDLGVAKYLLERVVNETNINVLM